MHSLLNLCNCSVINRHRAMILVCWGGPSMDLLQSTRKPCFPPLPTSHLAPSSVLYLFAVLILQAPKPSPLQLTSRSSLWCILSSASMCHLCNHLHLAICPWSCRLPAHGTGAFSFASSASCQLSVDDLSFAFATRSPSPTGGDLSFNSVMALWGLLKHVRRRVQFAWKTPSEIKLYRIPRSNYPFQLPERGRSKAPCKNSLPPHLGLYPWSPGRRSKCSLIRARSLC